MNAMELLKPCPYCGGRADLSDVEFCAEIRCDSCGAKVSAIHEVDAINKWNNRIDTSAELKARMQDGTLSDGYHSFNELYEYRMLYNAALFNEWASLGKYNVHKSTHHNDGQECFGGGWFIVVAILPTGQITNHYKLEYWDMFKIPEAERALFQYDGHTPRDAADRLRAAILGEKKED